MSNDIVINLLHRVSKLERKLANTVVEGVVTQVQASPYRVRVDYGTNEKPQESAWLPVAPLRAGKGNIWWPLESGEAVTIISETGNLERGRVFPSRYTDDEPPPSQNLDEFQINFGDGGFLHYNRVTHEGVLTAPEHFTIDSNVTITKKLNVLDTSTAKDHLSGPDRKSGDKHIHNESIGSVTSAPI